MPELGSVELCLAQRGKAPVRISGGGRVDRDESLVVGLRETAGHYRFAVRIAVDDGFQFRERYARPRVDLSQESLSELVSVIGQTTIALPLASFRIDALCEKAKRRVETSIDWIYRDRSDS